MPRGSDKERRRRWSWVVGLGRLVGTPLDEEPPEVQVSTRDDSDLSGVSLDGDLRTDTPPPVPPDSSARRFSALSGRITAALTARFQGDPPSRGPLREMADAQAELTLLRDGFADSGDIGEDMRHLRVDQMVTLLDTIDRLDPIITQKSDLRRQFAQLSSAIAPYTAIMEPPWLAGLVQAASAARQGYGMASPRNLDVAGEQALIDAIQVAWDNLRPHGSKAADFQQVKAQRGRIAELLAVDPGDDDGVAAAQGLLDQAVRAFDTGLQAADAAGANRLADDIADAVTAVEAAQRARALRTLDGDNAKDNRRALKAMTEEDPGLLKVLASTPDGRQAMDAVVDSYGKSVKKADRAFITELMKARFDLDQLDGDLTKKGLPRLYKIFRMVPESHTYGNDALKAVQRRRNFEPTSWYGTDEDTDEGVGKFHMVIQGARTGGVLGWAADTMASLHGTTKYREVEGSKSLNILNAVTLHEIGHAVDEGESYMEGQGKLPQFGAWKEETLLNVARAAMAGFKLKETFAPLSPYAMRSFVEKALKGEDYKSELTSMRDQMPDLIDWSALKKHEVFDWCKDVKLSGSDSGLWDSGSKSEKRALNGRVYQECYSGTWVSYAVSARAKRVTNYQFRSSGEWFADAYSVYYLGKLPDNHPLKPWLDAQSDDG